MMQEYDNSEEKIEISNDRHVEVKLSRAKEATPEQEVR